MLGLSIDQGGRTTVAGVAVAPSDRPSQPRLLQASRGTAQCADVDGDGLGGLARIEITFRDARSGEAIIAIITPRKGDISTSGRFGARIVFPGLNVSGSVDLVVRYAGSGPPG